MGNSKPETIKILKYNKIRLISAYENNLKIKQN